MSVTIYYLTTRLHTALRTDVKTGPLCLSYLSRGMDLVDYNWSILKEDHKKLCSILVELSKGNYFYVSFDPKKFLLQTWSSLARCLS